MASNLSTIGFVFADEDSFRSKMVDFAARTSAQLDCPRGCYGIWRSRSGAELWFHFGPSTDGSTEIFGLTPYYEGRSEVELRITAPIRRDTDSDFEGAFYGWANPDEDQAGAYPLVFDAVDFAARCDQTWPVVLPVKLVGFARELRCYPSAEDYLAHQAPDVTPKLAEKAFIPIGLFAAAETNAKGENGAVTPSSTAVLTGTVIEFSTLTNEATGRPFYWLLVESLDAAFDIVADPDIVAGDITVGGTVEATVWLFGRFIERSQS